MSTRDKALSSAASALEAPIRVISVMQTLPERLDRATDGLRGLHDDLASLDARIREQTSMTERQRVATDELRLESEALRNELAAQRAEIASLRQDLAELRDRVPGL